MKSILSRLRSNIDWERLDDDDRQDMTLIYNEIEEEMGFTPGVGFDLSLIRPGEVTVGSIEAARDFIDRVRKYYIEVSKNAVEARDQSIMEYERADKDGFIRMKKQYTNESTGRVRQERQREKQDQALQEQAVPEL